MGITNNIPPSRLIQPGVIDNAAARPASPFEGQCIFQKDTDQLLVWNGTAWVIPNQTTTNPEGLELVKVQTIGTAVSTVDVADAFSSTYDNYMITVNGGQSSASCDLRMRLGATNSGYYWSILYSGWSNSSSTEGSTANSAWPYVGSGTTTTLNAIAFVNSPNLAENTILNGSYIAVGNAIRTMGMLNNTTQYTAFTLLPNTGTLTGGTIRVYGYRNS
jgi:hypothetical protein